MGRIRSMFHYFSNDALYDERFLEGALQETLKSSFLFGALPGVVSRTKVALTATSGGNARSIFTNYSGLT